MTLQEVRRAVVSLQHPVSADELELWRRETLAIIDSSIPPDADGGLHLRLSPRERQVMDKLLRGHRLKQIAVDLDISVKTVTTHRARLLRKLRVEDNLGLYRYGIRNGLITA
jgi:DNA-binding NarL/FixJ family response regulator